jgi:tRNA(Ile)-lysidine synthase TilS/MesJ
LLIFSKAQLLSYNIEKNIPFVIDSSNLNSRFFRNYIRNEIFPRLGRYKNSCFFSLKQIEDGFNLLNKYLQKDFKNIFNKCKISSNKIVIENKDVLKFITSNFLTFVRFMWELLYNKWDIKEEIPYKVFHSLFTKLSLSCYGRYKIFIFSVAFTKKRLTIEAKENRRIVKFLEE